MFLLANWHDLVSSCHNFKGPLINPMIPTVLDYKAAYLNWGKPCFQGASVSHVKVSSAADVHLSKETSQYRAEASVNSESALLRKRDFVRTAKWPQFGLMFYQKLIA